MTSRLKLTATFLVLAVGGASVAPACTVSSNAPAGEGGDGNDAGATSTGGTSTGGTSTGGTSGEGGGGGGGATVEGGSGGQATAGAGGEAGAQGGGDAGGAGGQGGAVGKSCEAPASGQTSARGLSCADYCSAFFTDCASSADSAGFADESECLSSCELFDDAQLCCRAFHAAAASAVASNCADAAGDGECN
jgi:hypothetical protein